MIWLEAVAAAVVGLALLMLVLGPLIARGTVLPVVDDEPENLEETPKGIALSALKEIEFDQATGKLSDEDYAMLKGKYTAQALQALRSDEGPPGPPPPQQVSRGGQRLDLEAVIAVRAQAIRSEGAAVNTCPHCGPRPEPDAQFCSTCGCALGEKACAGCAATLAPGSRYCDQCGTRVAA